MPISIRPLHPVFVGEVAGVDCRSALSSAEVTAIEAGMDQYAVLVFREQNITDEEQLAFTRHFGELESYTTAGHIRRREEQRLGPGMADFSNLDKDCRIGANVKIVNQHNEQDAEGKNYVIRDGIVVIPKGAAVLDGTVI